MAPFHISTFHCPSMALFHISTLHYSLIKSVFRFGFKKEQFNDKCIDLLEEKLFCLTSVTGNTQETLCNTTRINSSKEVFQNFLGWKSFKIFWTNTKQIIWNIITLKGNTNSVTQIWNIFRETLYFKTN